MAYPGRAPLHAYATGLGLVALTFVGGILNALGAATRLGLEVCAYIGMALAILFLALSAREVLRAGKWRPIFTIDRSATWLLCGIIAALGVLLAHQLMPTWAFNY